MATSAKRPQDEDIIECFLYPKCCYTMCPDNITESMLNDEINKYMSTIVKYTNDHLWHRDSLTFHPRTKQALLLDQVIQSSGIPTGKLIF